MKPVPIQFRVILPSGNVANAFLVEEGTACAIGIAYSHTPTPEDEARAQAEIVKAMKLLSMFDDSTEFTTATPGPGSDTLDVVERYLKGKQPS